VLESVLSLVILFVGDSPPVDSPATFSNVVPAATPRPSRTPPIAAKARIDTKRRVKTEVAFEEDWEHTVPLPRDVLNILRKDEFVRKRSLKKGESVQHITASLFVAEEIDLNDDGKPDLAVKGSDESGLSFADRGYFWIFQTVPHGHRLVLSVDGNGFSAMKTKTHGFHSIESGTTIPAFSETELYTYNGREYRLTRRRTRPNR
jgi:hypothetical protein